MSIAFYPAYIYLSNASKVLASIEMPAAFGAAAGAAGAAAAASFYFIISSNIFIMSLASIDTVWAFSSSSSFSGSSFSFEYLLPTRVFLTRSLTPPRMFATDRF
jgi:hypothetical protein